MFEKFDDAEGCFKLFYTGLSACWKGPEAHFVVAVRMLGRASMSHRLAPKELR